MNTGGGLVTECRLFLRLEPRDEWSQTIAELPGWLAANRPASVLLPEIDVSHAEPARKAVEIIQRSDIAALVRNDAALAMALAADGLHASGDADLPALRRSLPAGFALGVECPLERHLAMVAGEMGADYLAFRVSLAEQAQALSLLSWWREMMVLPSVALIEDNGVDLAPFLAVADFFSPPP
jgi:thiamine-phosphate pyrophosphorylase